MPRLDRYPLLKHYGSLPSRPLTPQEAALADFDTRLGSIARLLVAECLRRHRRLSPEGQACHDPEDIFLAFWTELKRRDRRYDPGRGGYTTFAAQVIGHAWAELAAGARAVRPPTRRPGRPGRPDAERDRRAARAGRDPAPLPGDDDLPCPAPLPLEGLVVREDHEAGAVRLAATLGTFSAAECVALRALGVWDTLPCSLGAAAQAAGLAAGTVRAALRRARARLTPPAPPQARYAPVAEPIPIPLVCGGEST